ncbi:unnamed protein product [Rangifer tarandus platyrhynchus]|uniref:Uncharacterized protein n=1 Tax=Rangifer tarandus platyrhynchus TaxID=3082113 RepID=A0AC59YIH8_RANTA
MARAEGQLLGHPWRSWEHMGSFGRHQPGATLGPLLLHLLGWGCCHPSTPSPAGASEPLTTRRGLCLGTVGHTRGQSLPLPVTPPKPGSALCCVRALSPVPQTPRCMVLGQPSP